MLYFNTKHVKECINLRSIHALCSSKRDCLTFSQTDLLVAFHESRIPVPASSLVFFQHWLIYHQLYNSCYSNDINDVSTFTSNNKGSSKIIKVGHVTPVTPPFGSFIIRCIVLAVTYPTKKTKNVTDGSQNLKSRSRDPDHAPFGSQSSSVLLYSP